MMRSNKIKGLHTLQNNKLSVPAFGVIPHFTKLSLNHNDIELFNEKFKDKVINSIIDISKEDTININKPLSARSASYSEDTNKKSNAGKFLSYNGLSSIDELIKAIRLVWLHHNENSDSICPIIIQEYHKSLYSGICFVKKTKNNGMEIQIESFFGSCKSVCDGTVNPYRSKFSDKYGWVHDFEQNTECTLFYAHSDLFKKTKKIVVGQKLEPLFSQFPSSTRLYIDPFSSEWIVYGYRLLRPPNWYETDVCEKLKEIFSKMIFTGEIDLEWGFDPTGTIYFYQYRPITTDFPLFIVKNKINNNDLTKSEMICGLPASPGKIQGLVSHSGNQLNHDRVLMLKEANVFDYSSIQESVAVVTCLGGVLSHIGTVCRELKKPCVVGIGQIINENMMVSVDGTTGCVQIMK